MFQLGDGRAGEHEGEDVLYRLDPLLVNDEIGVRLIAYFLADGGHTRRQGAARPLPGFPQACHIVRNTLCGVLALQLCKCREDVHNGPSHRRRSVKGFFYRQERDIVLLQRLIDLGEVLDSSADTVQLVDDDDIEFVRLDIRHQFGKGRAVRILPGEPLVLVVDSEIQFLILEHQPGVVLARRDLHLHRVTVVPVDRFSWIDSDSKHSITPLFLYSVCKNGYKNNSQHGTRVPLALGCSE